MNQELKSQQSQVQVQSQQTSLNQSQELLEAVNQLIQTNQKQNQQAEQTQSTQGALAKKLTSRKFIMALAGVIIGVCGMIGFSDNTTAIIVFGCIEMLSIVGYMLVEGVIDHKSVSNMLTIAQQLMGMIDKNKNGEKVELPEDKVSDNILVDDTDPDQLMIEEK